MNLRLCITYLQLVEATTSQNGELTCCNFNLSSILICSLYSACLYSSLLPWLVSSLSRWFGTFNTSQVVTNSFLFFCKCFKIFHDSGQKYFHSFSAWTGGPLDSRKLNPRRECPSLILITRWLGCSAPDGTLS